MTERQTSFYADCCQTLPIAAAILTVNSNGADFSFLVISSSLELR
jgi:hypothetical protein